MSSLTLSFELLILCFAGLYAAGLTRLWARAGLNHGIPVWRAACFLGGAGLLAYAVAGPMDALADRSFAAHMLQHMLLMKGIPPLLLLGEFGTVFLHAIGSRAAHRLRWAWNTSGLPRRAWETMTRPWFAWTFFALSLWGWHMPNLYQAALRNEWLHAIEHLMFCGSAMLFWWYIMKARADRTVRYGVVVLMLFTTLLHESALGALLTFSSGSWYPYYAAADPWRLSPLSDQQYAGLIMWIPGGVLFGFLMEYYFGAWLKVIDRRAELTHPEYSRRRRA